MSRYDWHDLDMEDIIGETLTSITGGVGDGELIFTNRVGHRFYMYHEQDCCEHVYVEDIAGDLEDLIGTPIIQAGKETGTIDPNGYQPEEYRECYTWTFYKLATIKGSVTIRWYGSSNGYYSEGVEFKLEKKDE